MPDKEETSTDHEGSTNADEPMDTSVRVYIRIRPLNKREIAEKQSIGWNYNKTAMLEDTQNGQRVYAYDQVRRSGLDRIGTFSL